MRLTVYQCMCIDRVSMYGRRNFVILKTGAVNSRIKSIYSHLRVPCQATEAMTSALPLTSESGVSLSDVLI